MQNAASRVQMFVGLACISVLLSYRHANALPLKAEAKNQLSRASRSIALNLAEGRGRFTRKDQIKFFTMAMGSLRECQALLELEGLSQSEAFKCADQLGSALCKLIKLAR